MARGAPGRAEHDAETELYGAYVGQLASFGLPVLADLRKEVGSRLAAFV